MTQFANLHTHTVYCDGSLTPEEMVKSALSKGCASLGFSGHSHAPFDPNHSMSEALTRLYEDEVKRLKVEYDGQLEIFLGVEQEYYSDMPTAGYDFVIGSVHYVKKDSEYVCVDAGARNQRLAVDAYYGGDYYAFAEDYFKVVSTVIGQTSADIVGHFDLVTKYNQDGCCFDEGHRRYRNAALGAMERILKTHRLFEVNTGAMYRLGKKEPYPSIFLLRELFRRGGEVILSSDSHDADSLCHEFARTAELLRECGFKYQKRLTKNGFIDVEL